MKGAVVDIKKFAVHDGNGIRSTLFLKGCPLSCLWCHNPESISSKLQLWYFERKCIKCEKCISSCAKGALRRGKDGEPFILIAREKCVNAGTCVDVCPTTALAFDGRMMSSDEVLDILLDDKIFYRKSGGGVTVSGGEPFMQPEFLFEVLNGCKKEEIHTALETCLYASNEIIRKALDNVDMFITDLKFFDESQHLHFTGKSNSIILENFIFLAESGKDMLVRIPLIPNATANADNLRSIARFVRAINSSLKIELMNFNPLTEFKYRLMNKSLEFLKGMKPFKEEELTAFRSMIEEEGISTVSETKL